MEKGQFKVISGNKECFLKYHLNKNNNFLKCPKNDKGNVLFIHFESNDRLTDFSTSILNKKTDVKKAIFFITLDGEMKCAIAKEE